MHSLTLNIDDSIYSNFKSLLEMLPKEKAQIVEDLVLPEAEGGIGRDEPDPEVEQELLKRVEEMKAKNIATLSRDELFEGV